MNALIPPLSKEEITIARLRKRLARTQERAARLEREAGMAYLKSRASHFCRLFEDEAKAHAETKLKIRGLERQLAEATRVGAGTTLAAVRKLLADVAAEKV